MVDRLAACAGPDVRLSHGRPGLDVRAADRRHRRAGGAVCRYYLADEDPIAALLPVPAAVHGRDAGRRAGRQPDPAGGLLGADQPDVVPADRLLAAARRRARGRAHGAHGHRRRRAVPARRRAADRPHRRHDRPRRGAAVGRRCSARTRCTSPALVLVLLGRVHQERAVPVPLLAAARDGGADAGVGLPAFGDDGQGRRIPARAAVPGAGRQRAVVLDRLAHRAGHAAARRLRRDRSSTT